MAPPERGPKNRTRTSGGKRSFMWRFQWSPPSSVNNSTPEPVCVYGCENPPAAQPTWALTKQTDSSRQLTPERWGIQVRPPSRVCQIAPRSPTAQPR